MSNPLPTDPGREPGLTGDADRSARVEQLLLSGLDRYFAGQYEDAINIWTRVAFLERGHDRARAYIARARQALAERQRESDEVLERGIEAYHAGDVDMARQLLQRAVQDGGASDRALVFLERLGRVSGTPAAPEVVPPVPSGAPARDRLPVRGTRARGSRTGMLVVGLLLGAGLAGGLWAWLAAGVPASPRPVAAPVGDPLPLVEVSDGALDRATQLYASGDLVGALTALDAIDAADPLRVEADRLRATVQRAVLAGMAAGAAGEGVGP